MTPLVVIPCRAGSKGIPGKNFRSFCGRPLYRWTLDVAEDLGWPYVVTSDPEGYDRLADDGLPGTVLFRRPERDDEDLLDMIVIVREAIQGRDGDPIVLLQPTGPLRTAGMVRAVVRSLGPRDTSITTVIQADAATAPERLGTLTKDGFLRWPPTVRRQDTPTRFARDGLVYVTRRETLVTEGFYGPRCRLWRSSFALPHLDEPHQWRTAELLARDYDPRRFRQLTPGPNCAE